LCSLGNAGVREGIRVGSGELVGVGAIVGVRVGLGVNVNRGLGVIDGVIVIDGGISVVEIAARFSVDSASDVGFGLVNIRIDTIMTITNTIPSKPIRNICWLEAF